MPISQLPNKSHDHYGLNIMGKSTPWQKGVKIHFDEPPFVPSRCQAEDNELFLVGDRKKIVNSSIHLLGKNDVPHVTFASVFRCPYRK